MASHYSLSEWPLGIDERGLCEGFPMGRKGKETIFFQRTVQFSQFFENINRTGMIAFNNKDLYSDHLKTFGF